jgi:hypothetical protein
VNLTKIAESIAKIGGGLAVIAAIVIYVIHAETNQLRTDISVLQTNSTATRDDIASLRNDIKSANERIDKVLTDALDKLVTGKGGTTRGSELLEKGQTILAIAKSIDAKLKPDSLAGYGKLVSALTNSPSLSPVAWHNLTQAVNYRTFLNADYAPKPSDFTPATGNEDYKNSISLFPDRPVDSHIPAVEVGYAGGHVPQEQSARLESLTNPQPHGSGFRFFIIEGGNEAIVLDGMYMKNVIVRNARIIYNGAPVRLENVYFVNCTFRFPLFEEFHLRPQGPVRNLSNAILQATAVNYSTVAPA